MLAWTVLFDSALVPLLKMTCESHTPDQDAVMVTLPAISPSLPLKIPLEVFYDTCPVFKDLLCNDNPIFLSLCPITLFSVIFIVSNLLSTAVVSLYPASPSRSGLLVWVYQLYLCVCVCVWEKRVKMKWVLYIYMTDSSCPPSYLSIRACAFRSPSLSPL